MRETETMSSTGVAREVPKETKPKEEKKGRAPKAPKEKMPKGFKPSSAPSHPPYFQMIKEAIQALNEKTGSSPYAIAKRMEEKHKAMLPANFRKILAVQLRNFSAKGKLVKVKASFKLSDSSKKQEKKKRKPGMEKKEKKRKAPATDAAATPKKKKSSSNKGSKTQKPVVKKTKRAVMAKAKQPKSIKSPAAKRARKATVA